MTQRGNRAHRIAFVAAVLLGAAATTACGGRTASGPPAATGTSASGDDEVAAGLTEHHRFHHHGGVTLFIAMSLDTLGVSTEQHDAVEKIRSDLRSRMEPARTAEQNLLTTLADGLAAANLDTAKVDAAVAQVRAAAATVHDASTDALNQLHAVLTPVERGALVDKVEAHWAVWQKANAEDEAGTSHAEGSRLARLGTELDLSPSQLSQIRTNLGTRSQSLPRLDSKEVAGHLRAFGEAFRSESFDARSLATARDTNSHLAGWGAAYMAQFIEAVSPVLGPDQRAKLAQHLREHSAHDPRAPEGSS